MSTFHDLVFAVAALDPSPGNVLWAGAKREVTLVYSAPRTHGHMILGITAGLDVTPLRQWLANQILSSGDPPASIAAKAAAPTLLNHVGRFANFQRRWSCQLRRGFGCVGRKVSMMFFVDALDNQ
jgi:hypothetical protein